MTDQINQKGTNSMKFTVIPHMTIEQRNKLQQLAIADNRNVSNYIETILIEKIKKT